MTNLVANPDLESSVSDTYPGYGAIPSWTSSDTSRTGSNTRSGPFWDYATGASDANGANKVGFLQAKPGPVTLTQTITGLVVGQPHTLSYYINRRNGYSTGVVTLKAALGGAVLRSDDIATGQAWVQKTATFTPTATSADLVFTASGSGASGADDTALLTEVVIPQVTTSSGSGGSGSGSGSGGSGTTTTTTASAPSSSALFFAMELDVYQPGSGAYAYAYGRGARPRGSSYIYAVTPESSDTLRASDAGYRTRASDTGGLRVYPAVLDQAFEIDRHISLQPGQASTATFGSIRLSNLRQRFDAYIRTRNCDSRSVKLLAGRKPWDAARGIFVDPAYASLTPFFGGTASAWALSEEELEIPLRDATYLADRPLQQNTYTGSGSYNGGSDLVGRKIPITRGGTASYPVLNVPLVAVDAPNLIYQWTDGPGTIVTLYEGGAAVFTGDGDVSDIYAGSSPAAGHYRTCNARGLVRMGSKPVRALTADATGAFPVAGAISTAVMLARYLLTETLALPAALLDLPSFAAADTAWPFVAGFYVADDTRALDVVQTLLGSIGARLISTRSGLLSVFVLRKPASDASPSIRLSRLNVVNVTSTPLPSTLDPPPYRWRVGYGRINQVQTSDFTGSITDARKAQIATPYTYAAWSSSAVLTAWRRPNDPDPVGTALLKQVDAQTLANALGALFEGRPGLYSVEMPLALAPSVDMGTTVLLDWPLGDLAGGKIGQVIGEQVRSYDASATFTVLA